MAVDAQALLVQALLGGSSGARQAAVTELVAQNGDVDPTTQAILSYVLAQQAPDTDEDAGAELERLRNRNELVAAALGACDRCFGDDDSCPVCGGEGRPGWEPPDRRLFAEIVGPALERLRSDVH